MTAKKGKQFGSLVMLVGMVAVVCSGVLIWHNTRESSNAGKSVANVTAVLQDEIGTSPVNMDFVPDYKLNPHMDMPAVEIDGDRYIGQLNIPGLGLELSVMEQWSYEGMKKSPGRYSGTPYTGTFVICAHNYRSHFGMIKSLNTGDSVVFQDMDGNLFQYTVSEVREIKPYPDTQATESGYDLVLTTCTTGGRTRWAVFCSLAETV